MPATLPLELVLDIVRVYIQRDFFDENWPAYHHRIAPPLCLVCKDSKDVLQPVLWSHLRLTSSNQLKHLHAPALFKHVEEFLGLGPVDRIGQQKDERPAQLIRWKMPNVGGVVLRGFGRGRLSMEAWAPFAALRSLALDNYVLSDVPPTLRLSGLETLSLVRVRAWRENFRNFLPEQCTPSLRQLVLADLMNTEDANDILPECYLPVHDVDLRRLKAVQLEPQYGDMLPDSFVHPDGPFGEETEVLLVWSAGRETFEVDVEKESPQYLQLQIPSSVLDDEFRHFAKMVYRISDMVSDEVLSAVFLPKTVRARRSVKPWIEAAIKTLLDICIEFDVSVHCYSDWETTTGMSNIFLRCLDDSDMEDENQLISENRRWSSIADMPKDDDGTLWTLAEGLRTRRTIRKSTTRIRTVVGRIVRSTTTTGHLTTSGNTYTAGTRIEQRHCQVGTGGWTEGRLVLRLRS